MFNMIRSRDASNLSAATAVLGALFFFATACLNSVDAYAFSQTPLSRTPTQQIRYVPVINAGNRIHRRREDGSSVTLYLFPSSPSESAANLHLSQRKSRSVNTMRQETTLPAMSQSVLATCDTLPGVSTAHGLLSPEVVMRIADQHDLDQDGALYRFLKTYKSRGPMACLPMLGDPNVLPELTKAMRDIA
ncbi:hypothetical protein HJC23_014058 [Cyclotella cryptica]|uniref:Uncharacterized protein n=1 Tax=Cyclotella cryptica TaxID=29204 RepID=A0ABD3QTD8_9STRA|eukprot:CCRYP_002456-RA/>CCRYP_002456-RA protein AED:0.26 eAED:0.26 QI:0/-1/0/1/-1/1/1/0/189